MNKKYRKKPDKRIASFYYRIEDEEFIKASRLWSEKIGIPFSELIVLALKEFVFSKIALLDDFKEIYNKIVDKNIENTFVAVSGHQYKLSDLIENPEMIFTKNAKIR